MKPGNADDVTKESGVPHYTYTFTTFCSMNDIFCEAVTIFLNCILILEYVNFKNLGTDKL
jgi:hypothetical protein